MRSVVVLLAVIVGGCGIDGAIMPEDEQQQAQRFAGTAPDASPLAPDASRPSDTMSAQTPDTGLPQQRDSAPLLPSAENCRPAVEPIEIARCGHETPSNACGTGPGWAPVWLDGRQCAFCSFGGKIKSECTTPFGRDCAGADIPIICVTSCAQCQ